MFRKKLLSFRPLGNNTYGIYDPLGVILLNRLCLSFSNLWEHKFTLKFPDTLNPLCPCSLETEDTEHYFLSCQNNFSFRTTLVSNLNHVTIAVASLNPIDFLRVIIYRDKSKKKTNCKVLSPTIKFINIYMC